MAMIDKTWIAMALVACPLAAGCAGGQEPLRVINALHMNAEECVADPSAALLPEGRLDVALGSGYMLALAVQNQLASDAAASSNSAGNDGQIQIQTADVTLTSAGSPDLIDALEARDPALVDFRTTLASDSIDPGDTHGIFVEVISAAASEAFRDVLAGTKPRIEANVVVNARRSGSASGSLGDVETNEYTFPIVLCDGCLFTCSSCENAVCPPDLGGYVGGVCGNTQDYQYAPSACDSPAG